MNLERAHKLARERGPNMAIYWTVRAILQPVAHIYFRLRRISIDEIPRRGPVLVAANHRSFSDPFFIGMCAGRPLRFVAKVELFDKRWKARLLLALGAFPIKRGESDEQAMETARIVLGQGGVLGMFPEGTRVRPGPVGRPKRGIGRLALETGAPVVPIAIRGTDDIRKGRRIRPRRVTVGCGRPLTFPRPLEGVTANLASEVTDRIWSRVTAQWERLGGEMPIGDVVVVGAGSWGTAVATLLSRGGASVQLVCRTSEQAERLYVDGSNARYLPGVRLPATVAAITAPQIRWQGVDAVCFAVPSSALPAAIESVSARLPAGVGALVLSKGLVAPDGKLPSSYLLEHAGGRPVACLGGPAHALEAVELGTALTVASSDQRFCEQLRSTLRSAGVECETSKDVVGIQFAGVAKNAAALAAGIASSAGANAAGAAAGRVYAECYELARSCGGDSRSFAGVAGAGDLVATVLSPKSRNRRAGELLAEGVEAGRIASVLGQVPESVDMVPVLSVAATRAGVRAPAIEGLADLIAGRVQPSQWLTNARGETHESRAA